MSIHLEKVGKRFNREWIFKDVTYTFEQGKAYAILGSNGSGKSTLLQVACGYARPSSGNIYFTQGDKKQNAEHLFSHISLATPYLGIYEDFYLEELLQFHFKFKPISKQLTLSEIPELLQLKHALNRPIKQFSSGMKQRVRLGLAILSNTPYLFLDEPTSNLDASGKKWYQNTLLAHMENRMVIVCSNHQEEEIFCCDYQLEISDYKPKQKSK